MQSGGLRTKGITKESQENMPLITVITVVRNGEKTLEQTILSVINQTYTNIEYIIVDGASTDGTLDIIGTYEDRIDYWISEPDEGIFYAMNKGIELAKGELIGLINSDDWYEIDCCKIVAQHYADRKNTVLYGLIRNIVQPDIFEIYSCSPEYIYKKMPPHPTVFIPKNVYDKYGYFDISYKYCSDYDLLIRFKKSHVSFYLIETVLANFRFGEGYSSTFTAQKESFNMRYKHGLISYMEKILKTIAIFFLIKTRYHHKNLQIKK
jgi:glycosyltransferase involved in cell wall biosynthesis